MNKKLNILLAEDDEIIEKMTTFYLKRYGHEVDNAKNGNEAVNRFKSKEYDLILMDVQMPEMDGIQALKEIRRIEKDYLAKGHTTIIAVTTIPDKTKCLNAGADGYAQKPYDFTKLGSLLHSFKSS
jgi:CheY-like chemotaxis protein